MGEDGWERELRRRFGRLREADGGAGVPGFGTMRARAGAREARGGDGWPGWAWVTAGGLAVAAVAVWMAVVLPGSGARELEGLPPLFGESAGEVDFLRGVGHETEWLGRAGSDVLLPERAVAIRVL